MNIRITAAKKGGNQYIDAKECGLDADITKIDGQDSLNNPCIMKASITNTGDEPWQGVIHFQYMFDKNKPQFYYIIKENDDAEKIRA